MSLSMYQASIPVLTQALGNLAKILEKGEAHAASKKIDPAVFIQGRLYPDMYPLARQVQIATDVAKGGAARLAGQTPPSYADTETSFAELQARIARTLAFLQGFTPEQIDGSEALPVTLKVGGRDKTFLGKPLRAAQCVCSQHDHLRHSAAWRRGTGQGGFSGQPLGA